MHAFALLLLQVQSPPSHEEALRHRSGLIPRSITATFADPAPRIDGRLDDPIWRTVEPQAGFRRDVPSDGKLATQDIEVRMVYDRDALYVGARLLDDRPDLVSRRLNRRDSFSNFNDVFFVLIDADHDHRTQFVFGVTPAGERRDATGGGDTNAGLDPSWDPVWVAKTTIDSLGWVAEMRIPFSQLRFNSTEAPVWGIQFRRDNVRAGEAVDWQWSSRTEPGQVSKYGHLLGLTNVPSPRRLELLPYASSQARLTQGVLPGHPFDDGSVTAAEAGLDLKYGLTSDLTLTASVNPDFGQVEADPSVVNLTAFETFFEERRPLFVEGSNIFAFGVSHSTPRIFYSRRIGRSPSQSMLGRASFVDEPVAASILGAAKLSGRTKSGWSIGLLDAVTNREVARAADVVGGPIRRVPVEPLANYAVLRVRRDGNSGTGGVGFMGTAVNRSLDPADFPTVRRNAYAGAVDFFRRWRHNRYQLDGYFAASRIEGEAGAIGLAQRASARYFQRPDQSYVTFDPTATSLSGWTGEMRFNKVGGDWIYGLTTSAIAPGFELNDAGFQTEADRIRFHGGFGRQWLRPTRVARNAALNLYGLQALNFGGTGLDRQIDLSGSLSLHSFTNFSGNATYRFEGFDDRATRGGPVIQRPSALITNLNVSTDSRKLIGLGARGSLTREADGTRGGQLALTINIQTRRGANLSLSPTYSHASYNHFYLGSYQDPTASETFDGRYVFAPLTQNTLSLATRLNYYFTPNLSLQVYAEPFVATANFDDPEALERSRTYQFQRYGIAGSVRSIDPVTGAVTVDADGAGPAPGFTYPNPNFRIRSLRSNVVLRWEYRPGSTLFLVWNQGRFDRIADPNFRPFTDLRRIFHDDMQNVLLVKANYYFAF